MLRILYDDFDQKVKNIHDEMDLHHSCKKKACIRQMYKLNDLGQIKSNRVPSVICGIHYQ